MIIKAAKMIFNSGKIIRSYSDFNFGVTFLEHSVFMLTGVYELTVDAIMNERINNLFAHHRHGTELIKTV